MFEFHRDFISRFESRSSVNCNGSVDCSPTIAINVPIVRASVYFEEPFDKSLANYRATLCRNFFASILEDGKRISYHRCNRWRCSISMNNDGDERYATKDRNSIASVRSNKWAGNRRNAWGGPLAKKYGFTRGINAQVQGKVALWGW